VFGVEAPSIKVAGLHLNLIRDHDNRPGSDSRRCAASHYGLRPTGFILRGLPRTERLTPLPGTSTV
jgi:hypothetical protein